MINIKTYAYNNWGFQIFWSPPRQHLQNGELLGYYIGYKQTKDTDHPYKFETVSVNENHRMILSFSLRGLSKYTEYSITVQAFNKEGTGPTQLPIAVIYTEEDVPSISPHNVVCESHTSTTVDLSWEFQYQSPEINGVFLGFSVFFKPLREWTGW